MLRIFTLLVTALTVLLAGCASTIQSEVTAFHQWPQHLADKRYVFERTPEQGDSLEYRSYEQLVRTELQGLGFAEVPHPGQAQLKVSMEYGVSVRDVREVRPVNLPPPWYGSPWYGPYWQPYGYAPFYSPFHGPFYDPFWYGSGYNGYEETSYQLFSRRLNVQISRRVDGRRLYDVTVISEGRNGTLAAVMPYMVRSAFAEFPGPSGTPRHIRLKVKD